MYTTQEQTAFWIQWLQTAHPDLVDSMLRSSHHYDAEHLNPWHLEGDVWSHTMLVAQAYSMSQDVDVSVGLTALLHDIGKPLAVKRLPEKKRLVFKGHESMSAWISWRLLSDDILQLPLVQRIRVFQLVALHGCLYADWFSDDADLRALELNAAFSGFEPLFVKQLYRQISNDMAGQVTRNPNNKEDNLACLQDITFMRQPAVAQHTIPVIFLVGVAGAGKSSLRDRYAGYQIVSRDDCLHALTGESHYRRAWQQQEMDPSLAQKIDHQVQVDFNHALKTGEPILLDLTNLSRRSRRRWLSQLTEQHQAEAVIVMSDDQTLWRRNASREHKCLPDEALLRMMLSFDHPLYDEFVRIRYAIDGVLYDNPSAAQS